MNFELYDFPNEVDEASGVSVGRLHDEEFTREDGYLPNVLHHISGFQLHLHGQCLYERFCDLMAWDDGDFMWLISKMEEEFGCSNDIFGLFGHFRAQEKRTS